MTLVGLSNLGNSCFLNVVLQALASCSAMAAFLGACLREGGEDAPAAEPGTESPGPASHPCAATPFLAALAKLLQELAAPVIGRQVASPWPVMKALSEHVQGFDTSMQQDALEALTHLAATAASELQRCSRGRDAAPVPSVGPALLSAPTRLCPETPTAFLAAWKGLRWPLEGTTGSLLACETCGHQFVTQLQPCTDISLPMTLERTSPKIVAGCSVTESLERVTAPERLPAVSCDRCWHLGAASMCHLLSRAAEVGTSSRAQGLREVMRTVASCPGEEACACHAALGRVGAGFPRATSPAVKQLLVARAPQVLCLQIQRIAISTQGHLQKLTGHVRFPTLLDISPYSLTAAVAAVASLSDPHPRHASTIGGVWAPPGTGLSGWRHPASGRLASGSWPFNEATPGASGPGAQYLASPPSPGISPLPQEAFVSDRRTGAWEDKAPPLGATNHLEAPRPAGTETAGRPPPCGGAGHGVVPDRDLATSDSQTLSADRPVAAASGWPGAADCDCACGSEGGVAVSTPPLPLGEATASLHKQPLVEAGSQCAGGPALEAVWLAREVGGAVSHDGAMGSGGGGWLPSNVAVESSQRPEPSPAPGHCFKGGGGEVYPRLGAAYAHAAACRDSDSAVRGEEEGGGGVCTAGRQDPARRPACREGEPASPMLYELKAVIVHHGGPQSGHYTVYRRVGGGRPQSGGGAGATREGGTARGGECACVPCRLGQEPADAAPPSGVRADRGESSTACAGEDVPCESPAEGMEPGRWEQHALPGCRSIWGRAGGRPRGGAEKGRLCGGGVSSGGVFVDSATGAGKEGVEGGSCRDCEGTWFSVSDTHVARASLEEVLACSAHLLFYEQLPP